MSIVGPISAWETMSKQYRVKQITSRPDFILTFPFIQMVCDSTLSYILGPRTLQNQLQGTCTVGLYKSFMTYTSSQ